MNNEIILKDLGSIADKVRQKVKEEFTQEDIRLSKGFRDAFENYVRSTGSKVEYMATTAVITNASGQKIYAPNQWFVLAAYAVELIREIVRYRNYTEQLLDIYKERFVGKEGGLCEKKDIYKSLKTDTPSKFETVFKNSMSEMFRKVTTDEQIIQNNVKRLYRFVSDDKWWYGGKGIERTNDFYVSPALGVLNLVNASQSYVATITYAYVNDEKLSRELSSMILDEQEDDSGIAETMIYSEPQYKTGILNSVERNRIIFGAPGTGKSWALKQDTEKMLQNTEGTVERVTFHPDYSYAQFVGTYKPVSDSKGNIRYEFVAGPFMRVFVSAILSGRNLNPQPYVLLIEEINRAKVAAVFGDVFQLLDRDEDGVSEYEIQTSQDVRKYLAQKLGGKPEQWEKIKLPDNMFIWATMNSADQGVFPMDTAFKRRWSFEYLGINENEEGIVGTVLLGADKEPVVWNRLRKAINEKLVKEYKINEDKLMGPYFISKKLLKVDDDGMIEDQEKFVQTFKSKVIMYLYEDAAKQHKHKLFEGCDSSRYSSVCDEFDKIGIRIFGEDFKNSYYNQQEG